MGGEVTKNLAISSYQMMDGKNTTIMVINFNKNITDKSFVSGGFGAATSFNDSGKWVLEGNAGYSPNKNISLKTRLRSVHSGENDYTQLRESVTFKQKLNDKFTGYVTPYDAVKYNYGKGKFTNDVGIFGGVTYNVTDKVAVSAEAQCYNLQKGVPTKENLGANLILNVTF